MISNRFTSLAIPTPPAILNAANRTEVHAHTRPKLEKLEPGTVQDLGGEQEKEYGTHDERITFSNGGSIADLPGENGLLLTTPEGQQIELKNYGYVLPNWETNRMEVVVKVPNPSNSDQLSTTWIQGFNADGSVDIKRHREYSHGVEINANIASTGALSTNGRWEFGDYAPEARLENGALVLDDSVSGEFAFAPPVPLEWLVGR